MLESETTNKRIRNDKKALVLIKWMFAEECSNRNTRWAFSILQRNYDFPTKIKLMWKFLKVVNLSWIQPVKTKQQKQSKNLGFTTVDFSHFRFQCFKKFKHFQTVKLNRSKCFPRIKGFRKFDRIFMFNIQHTDGHLCLPH